MTTLSSSYDYVSGQKTSLAVNITATQTAGIKLAAMRRNGIEEAWTATSGILELRQERNGEIIEEWMSFNGISTNSDNTVTLTTAGVSRGIAINASLYTGTGTGQRFSKGSTEVRLVLSHQSINDKADADRANTFSAAQTIAESVKLQFADSDAYIYSTNSGTDLKFKDGNNSETTLTQLTALAGTDTKVRVSSNDTTSGFLNGKLVAGTGVTLTENNDGGDETLSVILTNPVTVALGGTGIATTTAYGILTGGTTATGAFQNVGTGSSGLFLKSNGSAALPTYVALTDTVRCVYLSAASSGTLTNPTSNTDFSVHSYAIPANDLTASVAYTFEATFSVTWGTSGQFIPSIRLGTTEITASTLVSTSTHDVMVTGTIYGTAAAGASVPVYGSMMGSAGVAGVTWGQLGTSATTVATNGGLTLHVSARFGTSDGGNSVTCTSFRLTKISTTAF